jgi:hypothetical protein
VIGLGELPGRRRETAAYGAPRMPWRKPDATPADRDDLITAAVHGMRGATLDEPTVTAICRLVVERLDPELRAAQERVVELEAQLDKSEQALGVALARGTRIGAFARRVTNLLMRELQTSIQLRDQLQLWLSFDRAARTITPGAKGCAEVMAELDADELAERERHAADDLEHLPIIDVGGAA